MLSHHEITFGTKAIGQNRVLYAAEFKVTQKINTPI